MGKLGNIAYCGLVRNGAVAFIIYSAASLQWPAEQPEELVKLCLAGKTNGWQRKSPSGPFRIVSAGLPA